MAKTFRKSRKSKEFGTLKEFAAALKVPLGTLSSWIRREDWKWADRAPWPATAVAKVLRWAADNLQQGRPRGASPETTATRKRRDSKLDQEVRKLSAQADSAETTLAKDRGQLIDAKTVEFEFGRLAALVRTGFENLPSQLTVVAMTNGMPSKAAPIFTEKATELVTAILKKLSNERPEED